MDITRRHPRVSKGSSRATAGTSCRRRRDVRSRGAAENTYPTSSDAGARRYGSLVARALREVSVVVERMEGELGRLDAVAGDGDHGRGMVRGTRAAADAASAAAAAGAGAGTVLTAAGDAWAARA